MDQRSYRVQMQNRPTRNGAYRGFIVKKTNKLGDSPNSQPLDSKSPTECAMVTTSLDDILSRVSSSRTVVRSHTCG